MASDSKYEDLGLVKPGILPMWQGEENGLELGHGMGGRALKSQPCVTAAAAGALKGCGRLESAVCPF